MRNLSIIETKTGAEKLEVFRLRYKIYIEEMHRGCRADHVQKMIRDELDDTAVLSAVYMSGSLVGTCRANFSYNCRFEHRDLYRMDELEEKFPGQIMLASKMMVLRDYRRGPVFVRLCVHEFEIALKNKAQVVVIDCNDHLVESFRRLGFLPYTGQVEHPDYGMVTPMILFVHDAKHLENLQSPFLPVLQRFMAVNSPGLEVL